MERQIANDGNYFDTDNKYTEITDADETGLPGLPMSWSPTLFSVSGPVGLPPVPWTEKKQMKVRHFSSDAEVIAAAETWLDG